MKQYAGVLSRVASTYEANFDIQQELFQEICVAIWQALERFKGNANIKTYILKIAHNRGISHVTKEVSQIKSHAELDASAMLDKHPNVSHVDIENTAIQSQQLTKLLSRIRALQMPARQVISLYLEGLSYDEIAEISGLSKTNVGASISRIKHQLREAIADE